MVQLLVLTIDIGRGETSNSSNTNRRTDIKKHKVSFEEATSGVENSLSSREINRKSQAENELRDGCKQLNLRGMSHRKAVTPFEPGARK